MPAKTICQTSMWTRAIFRGRMDRPEATAQKLVKISAIMPK